MSTYVGTVERRGPRWLRGPLAKLAAVTAVIAAVAGFLGALGDLGKNFSQAKAFALGTCRTMSLCKPDVGPAPDLPTYTSDWVDGGKSTNDFCLPVLKAYQSKYPNFTITMKPLPEQHDTRGEGPFGAFKHDVYKYSCAFAATPK